MPVLALAQEYTAGAVLAQEDRSALNQVLQAARNRNWAQAASAANRSGSVLAVKAYEWFYYTQDEGPFDFGRVTKFARENPDWPAAGKIKRAVEQSAADAVSDAAVIEWFDQFPPQSFEGTDRYLRALLAHNDAAKAGTVFRAWWPTASLTPEEQAYSLKQYGQFADRQAHIARLGQSLANKQYTNARALARHLGGGYPELAAARIALSAGEPGVDGALARVPAHLRDDAGLMFERLKWRRRNDKDIGAIEILHAMPAAPLITNPQEWWQERQIIVRRMIEKKQYESAYLLAAGHQQTEGVPFVEGEFLAGWLALSFLDRPMVAFRHFEALYLKAETAVSRSRGAYWAARASEKAGHADISRLWYQTAAQYQTAFYGQMAFDVLPAADRPAQKQAPHVTFDGKQAFEKRELVQMARLLKQAGMRKESSSFIEAMGEKATTPEEFRLVAELAEELGQPHSAVRVAKKAMNKGALLMDQLFPTMVGRMKNVKAEWALVHALMRQESSFDQDAISPVGARGLMQLMPATAKEVARKHNITYRPELLLTDPEKNIRLGSLYLQQMIARYDGSYPMALAAYNAGPGRVDRWLRENGDPRAGNLTMVDWIELIPISETRNYVQRVMEGVYVYRLKLRDVQGSFASPIHVNP